MTPRHWSRTRREARTQNDDPISALIDESVDAATSGKTLKAMRLLRFTVQLTQLRKKRRPLVVLATQSEAPAMPTPPAPPTPPMPPRATFMPPSRVTDPLAFTPEEEARFAAVRALRTAQSGDGAR